MELKNPDLHISFKPNPLKKSIGWTQAEMLRCKQVLQIGGECSLQIFNQKDVLCPAVPL